MTHNQRMALNLAHAIRNGELGSTRLHDLQWELMLLAAGMNRASASPDIVAARVIENSERRIGYFHCPDSIDRASDYGSREVATAEAILSSRSDWVCAPTG